MTDVDAAGGPAPRSAAERIMESAARRIAAAGAADLSLQDVAEAAGVSKALIHYHFNDKAELLTRVTSWLAAAVVARADGALAGASAPQAIDALWTWLDGELARGDVRVLLDLAQVQAGTVRAAAHAAAHARRAAAARMVGTLLDTLGLALRIPVPLMADVLVAFVDGLALDAALTPERNRRVSFDVFWLAMLSLAE